MSGVTGSGPTSTSQYVSSLQYRAWDAARHISYGNSVASDFTFNVRLQPTNYTLSNVVQNVGQPTSLSYDYTYYDDARMLHFSDNANHTFDRKYEYDHVGRLKEAYSGREANGQSPTTPRDNPYRQTYSYDEWDNLTGRVGAFWRQSLQDSSTYDAHGRRQGWGYDEAGQVLHDGTGDHFYDTRGSQGLFQSWKYFVGGGETGHPQAPGAEIEQSYDGQGQVVKRVETKRTETPHDPNDPNNPLTDILTDVTTTYYVRSSMLGGAAVLELAGSGNKSKGHVYSGGGELARQEISSTNPLVSAVVWQYGTPGTGSWVETSDTRYAIRMEMDPVGADVGKSDPFVTDPTPSYLEMRGNRPLYIDGGDPFDLSGGCTLDGLPVSCSSVMNVSWTTRLAAREGRVTTIDLHGYVFGPGGYGYDPTLTGGSANVRFNPSQINDPTEAGGAGSVFVDLPVISGPTPLFHTPPPSLPKPPSCASMIISALSEVEHDPPYNKTDIAVVKRAAKTSVPLLLAEAKSAGFNMFGSLGTRVVRPISCGSKPK